MNILDDIVSRNRLDYQRDYFDAFLKKVGFSYHIPSIHVTGTNGKGSTCNYLNNIYIASGRKVGLFVSPMNYSICDMIRINNNNIPESFIEDIFHQYEKFINKYQLSAFEITTFIALKYFESERVDVAIIECGTGGEIDATNIFTPILSIITSISVEHTSALGVSLSEIALHKAGIIKEKVPVLISDIKGDALDVIINKAKYMKTEVHSIRNSNNENLVNDGYEFGYPPYQNLKIKSRAHSSLTDACLAVEATNILINTLPVDDNSVRQGLYTDPLIGRFEIHDGQPTIIIDGAHNPEAIKKLRNDIDNLNLQKNIHVVLACFKDKNITAMLPEIGLLGELSLTTFNHPRARQESDYFLYLEEYKFFDDHIALIKSLKEQYPDDVILVTGSLAFACLVHKELLDGKI